MNNRLTELEVRYTLLEKLVQDLSEVVYRQQREVDLLKESTRRLEERLSADPGLVDASRNDRPPHY